MATDDFEEFHDEDDSESVKEAKNAIPWITAFEAFTKFGKPAPVLKALVKAKKLRVKKLNGKEVYSVADLEKLGDDEEEGTQETSMADLVNSARSMMGTLQTHHEKMFDKYMTAFDKVQQTLLETIDKGNKHVIALEEQAADMREAAEKVFNLEHVRKMEELKEQRTREMQAGAMKTVSTIFGPIIMQKLGGKLPGLISAIPGMEIPGAAAPVPTQEVENTSEDPRFAMLGKSVLGMIATMSDENFEALGKVIPEEEYQGLTMLRNMSRT